VDEDVGDGGVDVEVVVVAAGRGLADLGCRSSAGTWPAGEPHDRAAAITREAQAHAARAREFRLAELDVPPDDAGADLLAALLVTNPRKRLIWLSFGIVIPPAEAPYHTISHKSRKTLRIDPAEFFPGTVSSYRQSRLRIRIVGLQAGTPSFEVVRNLIH
jgi:hypothetical protein